MEHNVVIQLIFELVKASKAGNCYEENGERLFNPSYLLNQTLRQYGLQNEHYFVSEKADALWKTLTTQDIMKFSYHDPVRCDRANGILVKEYVGNSMSFKTRIVNQDDVITYRSIFHDEHIVPIHIIQKELYALKPLGFDSVKSILNKIRICKMLKEEDKNIVSKSNRSSDYRKAIADNYTPKGIVCINVVTKERI